MNSDSSAAAFTRLHVKGSPLVVYNIWDAGSARAVRDAGAVALATGSAAVSWAQGYEDGEQLPLEDLLRTVEQIVRAVDRPVSVDIEGGYGTTPDDVAVTAVRLARAGAVGCNFEDRIIGGQGLFTIEAQVARLVAMRSRLVASGLPMHINARTDVFLNTAEDAHEAVIDEVIARAEAYQRAGADSLFVPGLVDGRLIATLCGSVTLPVNVMVADKTPSMAELYRSDVARVSYGPGPYLHLMRTLTVEAHTALEASATMAR